MIRSNGIPLAAVAALLFLLGACAPSTTAEATAVSDELRRTALNAYHRMEIAYLEEGTYTTNVLVDLPLPPGVKWTLQDYGPDNYLLRFTQDSRPDQALLVSPAGVMPEESGTV